LVDASAWHRASRRIEKQGRLKIVTLGLPHDEVIDGTASDHAVASSNGQRGELTGTRSQWVFVALAFIRSS